MRDAMSWIIPGIDGYGSDRRFSTLGRAKDMADCLALRTGQCVTVWTETFVGPIGQIGEVAYVAAPDRGVPMLDLRRKRNS